MREIPQDELNALWSHCVAFMKEQNVSGPEAVYQSDNVITNAYDFIEGIGNIVGWNTDEEDEE